MNIGFEHSCIILMDMGTVSLVYIHVGVKWLPLPSFNVYVFCCCCLKL